MGQGTATSGLSSMKGAPDSGATFTRGNSLTDSMARSSLADRFRLQVHTVTAEAAVLALILDKPGATGPRIRPHSEGQPCDFHLASPTPAVAVFPPVCEEPMAIPAPHAAVLIASRDSTIEQLASLCFLALTPDSPGSGPTGTQRSIRFHDRIHSGTKGSSSGAERSA